MSRLWIKLNDYLIRNDIKKIQLAVKIEVCRQTISNWKDRQPHRKHAEKLVKFTAGHITMKDCGY